MRALLWMAGIALAIAAGAAGGAPADAPAAMPAQVILPIPDNAWDPGRPDKSAAWAAEACIQAALAYYGSDVSQAEVNEAGQPEHAGLRPNEVDAALDELGAIYERWEESEPDLRRFTNWIRAQLRLRRPVLCGARFHPDANPEHAWDHFVLAVGFTDVGLVLNTQSQVLGKVLVTYEQLGSQRPGISFGAGQARFFGRAIAGVYEETEEEWEEDVDAQLEHAWREEEGGAGPIEALPSAAEVMRRRLLAARTWMCQLDGLANPKAVAALAGSAYPLLVLEPGSRSRAPGPDAAAMVRKLRCAPDGSPRLLLAYLEVGRAESWRPYWRKEWRAPRKGQRGSPDFLLEPAARAGRFQVAYWDPRWKAIWLGAEGVAARMARLGFDGVYLAGVDACESDAARRAAKAAGVDPQREMIRLITELRAAGSAVSPGFLVVAQGAPFLLDADPEGYTRAVDAAAFEATWFGGDPEAAWGARTAGDLAPPGGAAATARRLARYREHLKRGLPVFTLDYCLKSANAALVYRRAREAGLRPLVTRAPLSRITETPPGALK